MENLSEKFLLLWEKGTPEEQQEDYNRERKEEQKKIRALWKRSEIKVHTEIMLLVLRKKMVEHEELYAKKLARKKAGEKGLQAHNQLMAKYRKHAPLYLQFRDDWIASHPDREFEDITAVRAMIYTKQHVPQYVHAGCSNSLQIYCIKIKVGRGPADIQWPLQVFGVVAVRDSIDFLRNIVFYRDRDDCQILTEESSYLTLTGPTRAVGMNEAVTIEAELKLKDSKGKDKYFILEAKTVPVNLDTEYVEFTGARGSRLQIVLGELHSCVEATIFLRVIGGTWPDGLQGYFAASTNKSTKEILLIQFRGDGESIRGNGNMTHLRHVVSVEDSGELIVSCSADRAGEEVVQEEVEESGELIVSGRGGRELTVSGRAGRAGEGVVREVHAERAGEGVVHEEVRFKAKLSDMRCMVKRKRKRRGAGTGTRTGRRKRRGARTGKKRKRKRLTLTFW